MPGDEARRRPRFVWIVAAVVVVVVGGVAALTLSGAGHGPRGGTTPSPGASASSADTTPPDHQASATPGPGEGASQTPVPSPSLPPPTATGSPHVVKTSSPAKTIRASLHTKRKLGNGVAVTVTEIEPVQGVAHGPGEIAGPALRVSVEVANGTNRPVDLEDALVNMYYSKAKTPAHRLSGPGVEPFRGSVAPGKAESGRYVFRVPDDQRKVVTVEFSYSTHAPTVIFSGTP